MRLARDPSSRLAIVCAALAIVGLVSGRSTSVHMSRLMRAGARSLRGRIASFQLLLLSGAIMATLPLATWWLDAHAASGPWGLAGLALATLALVASGRAKDAPCIVVPAINPD